MSPQPAFKPLKTIGETIIAYRQASPSSTCEEITQYIKKHCPKCNTNPASVACTLGKAAKKLGMSADAITAAIAERKREPLERVQHFRKMARYLRLMGAPLGTQLTIFDEGLEKTGLTGEAPSDGNVVSFEDGAAYEQGYRAGKSGKSIGDGPYTEDSDTGVQWAAGYNKAQKDLAEEMALATKPARGRRREHETDPLPAV